ncbi:MAG: Zn-ribbon domain-containing OB-fold protein [Thermoplasmatota archaeon]
MFKWFGKVNFVPYTKVAEFAEHLREGRIMGTRCKSCGHITFPPRADCDRCLGSEWEFVPYSGRARLVTFTQISAAPTGFEDLAPYTIGLADLPEGGRALAWVRGVEVKDLRVGMDMRLVPHIFEETPEIKLYYTLEKP